MHWSDQGKSWIGYQLNTQLSFCVAKLYNHVENFSWVLVTVTVHTVYKVEHSNSQKDKVTFSLWNYICYSVYKIVASGITQDKGLRKK